MASSGRGKGIMETEDEGDDGCNIEGPDLFFEPSPEFPLRCKADYPKPYRASDGSIINWPKCRGHRNDCVVQLYEGPEDTITGRRFFRCPRGFVSTSNLDCYFTFLIPNVMWTC